MRKKTLCIASLLAFLVGLPNVLLAVNSYQTAFNKLYKLPATSPVAQCIVCHTSKIPVLNPYGKAFSQKHRGSVAVNKALTQIKALDSDGDGFTNIVEIKAGTFPGKTASKPAAAVAAAEAALATDANGIGFTNDFILTACTFSSKGSNRYFVLQPGYQSVLEGKEDGVDVQLTITVLHETKEVDGVVTRIVEERETQDGKLAEVSRNYFAICKQTDSVFYFGEDVDIYDANGKIVSHDGSWQAGVNDAEAGLIMPGIILLGAKYYQEMAPEVAMDRAQIISMTETVETFVGDLDDCLKTRETSTLSPDKEYKFYAPGIGLIKDGTLTLVSHGFVSGQH